MEGKEERSADCQTAAAQQTGTACTAACACAHRAVHVVENGIGDSGQQQQQQGLRGRLTNHKKLDSSFVLKTDFIWDLQLLVVILYARGTHVLEEGFH